MVRHARATRRLTDIQAELRQLAGERQVLRDQLVALRGAADEAQSHAAVRPTRVDRREAEAAARDVTNHQRLLDELDTRREALGRERDDLLDDLLDTEDEA